MFFMIAGFINIPCCFIGYINYYEIRAKKYQQTNRDQPEEYSIPVDQTELKFQL